MHLSLLTGGISAERPIALRSCEGLKSFIAETNHTCEVYDIPRDIDDFLGKYQEYDIVFPYIHGRYGEDGIITGLCETLGLRYIGSPATTHALCIDKFRTNCVIEKLGLSKVPKSWVPGMTVPKLLGLPEIETLSPKSEGDLPTSVIVKPNCGGSTVATNKAKTLSKLWASMEEVRVNAGLLSSGHIRELGNEEKNFLRHFPAEHDVPLIQEYIDGDEYTVGVVGPTDNPEVLPLMQIVNVQAEIFDWQEKYETDGSNEIFPENLDPKLRNELEETSRKIYTALGCRGVARIDYRVRGNEIFFLEVNTFPGATKASFIPKMWQKSGRNMAEFIEMLVKNSG